MHSLARELFPFPRSITGDGVRQTLRVLARELPGLVVHEVPSGTSAFDWTVPNEWNIYGARVTGPSGEQVIDFFDSNLHVVSYSEPVHTTIDKFALDQHIHSDPEIPESIPYVTSYYHPSWGICMADRDRQRLSDGPYRVDIDSRLEPGSLSYGELLLHVPTRIHSRIDWIPAIHVTPSSFLAGKCCRRDQLDVSRRRR